MSLDLPSPVAAYFAADKDGAEAVALCFTDDAIVTDEGRAHAGLAEIRRWKTEAQSRFDYASELVVDGAISVTARVTGNFPGIPVDLRYLLRLEGERIASLEIVP